MPCAYRAVYPFFTRGCLLSSPPVHGTMLLRMQTYKYGLYFLRVYTRKRDCWAHANSRCNSFNRHRACVFAGARKRDRENAALPRGPSLTTTSWPPFTPSGSRAPQCMLGLFSKWVGLGLEPWSVVRDPAFSEQHLGHTCSAHLLSHLRWALCSSSVC